MKQDSKLKYKLKENDIFRLRWAPLPFLYLLYLVLRVLIRIVLFEP
jgi:hypothetical protein